MKLGTLFELKLSVIKPYIQTHPSKITRLFAPYACLHCKNPSLRILCTLCRTFFKSQPQLIQHPAAGITRLYSAYAMIGVNASVLKHWKNSGATGLNILLMNWSNDFIHQIQSEQCDYFIPIPQSEKRTRRQGFARVNELTQALHRLIPIPILHLLDLTPTQSSSRSLNWIERITKPNPLFIRKKTHSASDLLGAKKIALIDDFFTTGQTLSFAAETLHQAYPNIELIGITLGIRPQKVQLKSKLSTIH